MTKTVRIGSRDSALATWQAKEVQRQLSENNVHSEIIFIKSIGDLVQDKPLHSIGTVGVFTKALDDALLNNSIDIAVHSCKDLPSEMHDQLQLCAFLEREICTDVLVGNAPIQFLNNRDFSGTIATGSVRRKAQILAHFPNAKVVGLRGNVPTRLKKLKENNWDGAVFAWAGLKRLGIQPPHTATLQFMTPAPAQGVVAVACRKNDEAIIKACSAINHPETERITRIEREFLRLMEGGCISPIGANARITTKDIEFSVAVHSTDGSKHVQFTDTFASNDKEIARKAYQKAKELGAKQIINEIETNA